MSGADFLGVLFDHREGYLSAAFGRDPYLTDKGKYAHHNWRERSYRWPAERPAFEATVAKELGTGAVDVYVCPALRKTPARSGFTHPIKGSNAAALSTLWADADGALTEDKRDALDPVVVASGSADHLHVYVLLDQPIDDVARHRALNEALRTYLGADAKFSDESLLRLPGTLNFKPTVGDPAGPPTPVEVIKGYGRLWAVEELEKLFGVEPGSAPRADRCRVDVSSGAEPAPDPLPFGVQYALDHDDIEDKSVAHHRVVAACVDNHLTLGQTLSVTASYAPSVDKYDGRLEAATEYSWRKITADREDREAAASSANGVPSATVVGSEYTPVLPFQWFDELAAEVDAAPPRKWLIRNIWPAGDYGMLSAPPKAQKTWTALDLAVSVAAGQPWLGYKPIDTSGPVLVFVGEGGKGNTVRRVRAIAEEKGISWAGLKIAVCARAPHLKVAQHLAEVAEKVTTTKPALVIIDPLYLAARGADLKDLYAMGEILENIQVICQSAGASLMLVHHFNRNKGLSGAERNSGAGPQEWARVLLSVDVVSRKAGERPGETVTVTTLDVQGGEVPEQTLRVTRRVWADDPDELASPMHLLTVVTENESESVDTEEGAVKLGPGEVKLINALVAAEGPRTISGLVDLIAERNGHGLHEKTMTKYLNRFLELGWVDHEPFSLGEKFGKRWFLSERGRDAHNPRSDDVTTPHVGGPANDLQDLWAQNPRSDDVTTPRVTCRVTPEQGTWSVPPIGGASRSDAPSHDSKITNGATPSVPRPAPTGRPLPPDLTPEERRLYALALGIPNNPEETS